MMVAGMPTESTRSVDPVGDDAELRCRYAGSEQMLMERPWFDRKGQSLPVMSFAWGGFHWARTETLLKLRRFWHIDKPVAGYHIEPWRALDIDTPEDYEFAKVLARCLPLDS